MGSTETKPFFLTSEFAAFGAAVAGLAITAASSDDLDAGLLWPLAVVLAVGFVVSRGFSKAHSATEFWDPREAGQWQATGTSESEERPQMSSTMQREEYGYGPGGPGGGAYGFGRGMGMRQAFPIETKPFFFTSEFWGAVALIVALAIAAGTSDEVDARLFWILTTAITIAYVVSRGIAKSGTKSRSWDPREQLGERMRDRQGGGASS